MKVTKIESGKYQVTAHGFVFTLLLKRGRIGRWVLWNKSGVEVMWSDTKTSILKSLKTYNGHDFESIDTQEWAVFGN
jgi:hypothetical protein